MIKSRKEAQRRKEKYITVKSEVKDQKRKTRRTQKEKGGAT